MMLDERITHFVHKVMRIKAREFDEDFAMRLMHIDSQAVLAGQMGGSGRTKAYALACRQELRNRAHYLFIEIQRAVALYRQAVDEEFKNQVIGLHITELRTQCTGLQNMLGSRLGKSSAFGESPVGQLSSQLNEECEHLNDKYNLEIVAFFQAAATRSAATDGVGGGVVINGSVGVVQTGAYASATLRLNVGADDRDAMLNALELVAATMRDSRQLTDEHRRQMLEVVEQAKMTMQQQPPNGSLLRGMFTVLCETLQTLAASAPAMAALRAAALPFGISL